MFNSFEMCVRLIHSFFFFLPLCCTLFHCRWLRNKILTMKWTELWWAPRWGCTKLYVHRDRVNNFIQIVLYSTRNCERREVWNTKRKGKCSNREHSMMEKSHNLQTSWNRTSEDEKQPPKKAEEKNIKSYVKSEEWRVTVANDFINLRCINWNFELESSKWLQIKLHIARRWFVELSLVSNWMLFNLTVSFVRWLSFFFDFILFRSLYTLFTLPMTQTKLGFSFHISCVYGIRANWIMYVDGKENRNEEKNMNFVFEIFWNENEKKNITSSTSYQFCWNISFLIRAFFICIFFCTFCARIDVITSIWKTLLHIFLFKIIICS